MIYNYMTPLQNKRSEEQEEAHKHTCVSNNKRESFDWKFFISGNQKMLPSKSEVNRQALDVGSTMTP